MSALCAVLSVVEVHICYYLEAFIFFFLILEVPFLIQNYALSSSGIHQVRICPCMHGLMLAESL